MSNLNLCDAEKGISLVQQLNINTNISQIYCYIVLEQVEAVLPLAWRVWILVGSWNTNYNVNAERFIAQIEYSGK